jgi:hypothetical protein
MGSIDDRDRVRFRFHGRDLSRALIPRLHGVQDGKGVLIAGDACFDPARMLRQKSVRGSMILGLDQEANLGERQVERAQEADLPRAHHLIWAVVAKAGV